MKNKRGIIVIMRSWRACARGHRRIGADGGSKSSNMQASISHLVLSDNSGGVAADGHDRQTSGIWANVAKYQRRRCIIKQNALLTPYLTHLRLFGACINLIAHNSGINIMQQSRNNVCGINSRGRQNKHLRWW